MDVGGRLADVRFTSAVVAAAIAALQDHATPAAIAAAAGLPEAECSHVVEQLRACGAVRGLHVLHVDAEAASTAAATVDQHVLDTIGLQAAEVVRAAGAADVDVAAILLRAPTGAPWALDVLCSAAEHHRSVGDHRGAAAAIRRALDEEPTVDVARRLRLLLARETAQFDTTEAVRLYEEVIPEMFDADERSAARLRLARCLGALSDVADAVAAAETAAREATTTAGRLRADLTMVALARQSLDTRALGRERLRQLGREAADCVAIATSAGADVPADARALLAEVAYEETLRGDTTYTAVIDKLMIALGGESLGGIHDLPLLSRHVALLSLGWSGEFRLAEQVANAVIADARHGCRSGIGVGPMHQVLVSLHFQRGRLADAIAAADTVLGLKEDVNAILPAAVGQRAGAIAWTGRVDEALDALALPEGEGRWSGLASFHGYLIGKATVHLVAGDHTEAYRSAQWCGTLAGAMGTMNHAVLPWRTLAAEAAAAIGQHEVGRRLSDDALTIARRFGAPGPLANALRTSALFRASVDRLEMLEEAAAVVRTTPLRLEEARVALARAWCRSGLGDVAQATAAAEDAASIAGSLGAVPIVREAEQVLRRVGRPHVCPGTPAAASRPTHHVRVLGSFAITDGRGHDVTPGGVPARAVRIVVALGGHLHIEELAEHLWTTMLDPEQVRARLPNVISRTGTAAGRVLVRDRDTVALAHGVAVDADAFEAAASAALAAGSNATLEEAVAAASMYAGDLLPTDPYADWATLRREQLRQRYLNVADLAARLAADAGLSELAVDLLETAIRHDRYDLERYDLAVETLEATGRLSAARAMRDRAARTRRELGL